MKNQKQLSKSTPILTLVAESEKINHREMFTDNEHGNKKLAKCMKWLQSLNNLINGGVVRKRGQSYTMGEHKLTVTITKN